VINVRPWTEAVGDQQIQVRCALSSVQQCCPQFAVVQGQASDQAGFLDILSRALGSSAPSEEVEDRYVPACDLELKKADRNRQLLRDFAHWFCNY
jgi:hypothetical protein